MFRLLIQLGNLIDAALMASTRELRSQKTRNHFYNLMLAQHSRTQRQHIGIIMFAAHLRGQRVMCNGRANPADFVCRDGHADSSTANQNSEIAVALLHAPRDLDCEIRVIDRFLRPRSCVVYRVSSRFQISLNVLFSLEACMVGAQRN